MSGGDLDILACGHRISSAQARSKIQTSAKVEAQGFGSGLGKIEPLVSGSLTQGQDQRYEIRIRALEVGKGGGTSWLGLGQKRNSVSRISYSKTSIEATR